MSATAQPPVLIINNPAEVAAFLDKRQEERDRKFYEELKQLLFSSDPLNKYPGAELSLANVKEIMGGVCDNTAKKRLAKLGVERIGGKNRYDKEVFRKAYFGK